jgi:hypothetical protein
MTFSETYLQVPFAVEGGLPPRAQSGSLASVEKDVHLHPCRTYLPFTITLHCLLSPDS